jgi:uncharacterized protein YcsI (UPF0317 family)
MFVVEGTTVIDTRAGAPTRRVETADIVPTVAVITAVPCPVPEAAPVLLISETLSGTENQVAEFVRFCVLASEYVPITWYCWVKPNATVAEAGVSASATNAGAPMVTTVEAL